MGKSQPPAMKQSKIRLSDCSAYTLFVSRHKRGYLQLNVIFSKQLNLIESGEKKKIQRTSSAAIIYSSLGRYYDHPNEM